MGQFAAEPAVVLVRCLSSQGEAQRQLVAKRIAPPTIASMRLIVWNQRFCASQHGNGYYCNYFEYCLV
jgi:hypothetical protein